MLSSMYSVIFLLYNLHLDIVSADTSLTEFISQLKKQNFIVCPTFSIISNLLHIQNKHNTRKYASSDLHMLFLPENSLHYTISLTHCWQKHAVYQTITSVGNTK
jgi:hypothetical protein